LALFEGGMVFVSLFLGFFAAILALYALVFVFFFILDGVDL
jgi:hypothetical protein